LIYLLQKSLYSSSSEEKLSSHRFLAFNSVFLCRGVRHQSHATSVRGLETQGPKSAASEWTATTSSGAALTVPGGSDQRDRRAVEVEAVGFRLVFDLEDRDALGSTVECPPSHTGTLGQAEQGRAQRRED
jgi:hypothetical protein